MRDPKSYAVVPLTPDLVTKLTAEAQKSLNGNDNACSLRDMQTSCFASEMCASNPASQPLMNLRDVLHARHAYVAVAHDGRFVGCVSANCIRDSYNVQRYFPHTPLPEDALLLSNLCVNNDFRKQGVGRELVDTIRRCNPSPSLPVYLMIDRRGIRSDNHDVAVTYESRVPRLLHTYEHLDFKKTCACEDAIMMQTV